MMRPSGLAQPRFSWFLLFLWSVVWGLPNFSHAQGENPAPKANQETPPVPDNTNPGQFFTIVEPITDETLDEIRAATRQLVDRSAEVVGGKRPTLVFEIRPGESAPGKSEFGNSYDLAYYLMKRLAGARLTVAYIPEPLKGYAVLPALACDEIVMGPNASLGPITPEDEQPRHIREAMEELALAKQRDAALLLGMGDPSLDLRTVRTGDNQVRYLLADKLDDFKRDHQVLDERPAWEGGQRGVLTAKRAREEQFSKLTAENATDVAKIYRLSGRSMSNDPTLGKVLKPVWIKLDGPIDSSMKQYVARRIEQARQEQVNLIFFKLNSEGGEDLAADGLADLISGIKDMKTVAFIDDRALGLSSLVALACHELVLNKGAELGDISQVIVGRGSVFSLSEAQRQAISNRAATLAELRGHPPAVARAMVDPELEVVEATDNKTGAASRVLSTDVEAEPNRYLNPRVIKTPGAPLKVTSEDTAAYGLGSSVESEGDFLALYGLRGKLIRVDGPTWVDSLVTVLTDPFVSWFLLFVGLFMLVLELKLPGIGLPAIMSSLAFLLFFWSHYLSGTADQLEIILFLVGLVCLALELFVFPGFGVFGMAGVLLVLTSIVMASHTFVWPTQEYEYRELGFTLLQICGVMVAVGAGAIVLARYFPSLPLFNRLVLNPEPWTGSGMDDETAKPSLEGYDSLAYLIGETGRTTTLLRPTGKARFGDLLLDVIADGYLIEPDVLVEVIDVQGSRVIVRQMDL